MPLLTVPAACNLCAGQSLGPLMGRLELAGFPRDAIKVWKLLGNSPGKSAAAPGDGSTTR